MRIAANITGFAMVTLMTAGCASLPPVNLEATPGDMEMLAGEWQGEYTSAALGRSGSIEFKLVAGENLAHGAVLMIPQGSRRPYEPSSRGETSMLTIQFVRSSAGDLDGRLDPYWDPDRQCQARTIFRGHLTAQKIEGTFATNFDCGAGEATGQWQVTRKPAPRLKQSS